MKIINVQHLTNVQHHLSLEYNKKISEFNMFNLF
jgi:hypothetical protein